MSESDNGSSTDAEIGRKKIIYVDDVQYSLITVKKRLKEHYEIYPAESTIMLYKILERIKPALILLDINMPGIDGFKTIKSLKADERYSQIPIVFVSGNSDKESIFKGMSLGAADYVIKPFITSKLIECIEKHAAQEIPEQPLIKKEPEDSHKPRVLVVDDVISTLRAVQFALQDNYHVYTLSKPESVLEFLKEKKPDLILMDYLMPVLSGFDLIPLIRAMPEYINTPIIILTSEGTIPQLNEAITLGASDFIVKPFKTDELNDKIAKQIKKSAASKK